MTSQYGDGRVHLIPLAEELRSGTLDLLSYLREVCASTEVVDAPIHAILPEGGRWERMAAQGASLEAEYPLVPFRPGLFGVPFGVKDIIRVDGFETHAGSRLPSELFAGNEASSVTALRQAGALVFGKTVTTEFAVFEPGPTRNPNDLAHTPGGSSSGSAAAVAAGILSLALGTQTIGSIIRPAAYCGVVGVKPTTGRVPGDGVVPCSPSLDGVGFFTADVGGARRAAQILCDGWRESYRPTAEPPCLGVITGPYLERATDVARREFDRQVNVLQAAGYRVQSLSALQDIGSVERRHRALMFGEMAAVHARWFERYRELYGPSTVDCIRYGQTVTEEEMEDGRLGRHGLRHELEDLMDREGIDLWISPAATGPAPAGIGSTGDPAMNLPWTHAGVPVLTVPAGSIGGLPIGIQVAGRFGADEDLLHWSEGIEGAISGSATATYLPPRD